MRQMCDMSCARFGLGPRNAIALKIAILGWGLFLLWVGASFLFDVGWGIGLIGVGILTLIVQVVRRAFRLRTEGFWVLAGCAFMALGVWELAAIDVSVGPVLLIVFGIVVVVFALGARRD